MPYPGGVESARRELAQPVLAPRVSNADAPAGLLGSRLEGVRVGEVRVGETYLVEVPHRLPAGRYPDADRPAPGSRWFAAWWLRGCRFRLTVTGIHPDDLPPMVDGLRLVPQTIVQVDLVAEQVDALGLPPDGSYQVQGTLTDDEGRLVALPDVDMISVPARWLYPAGADRPRSSHRDIDQRPW